ncbi:MarR family transcriptional regulator [Halobacterium sp. R2-5]|uniref:helix-turn-helix transcriptional regulator n=1 Tax=Halobacterium sp. R2-5 TaxID=2715751 RepID=UPI0014231E5D|nr:MarR family transcriptional regulator [Halobacterium sp. R2-5]NIB99137.1 MarR family transcriptional regulator [Halobacterium sp. R2-5]
MNRRTLARLAACLVFASAVVAGSAAPVAAQPGVQAVEYTGDSDVPDDQTSLTLWRSGPHQFDVTVAGAGNDSSGRACLVAQPVDGNESQELACESFQVPANGTTTVTVGVSEWPAELTGQQEVRVELRSAEDSRLLAASSFGATVIERDGDVDGDGLTNEQEVEVGSSFRVPDTDGDGLDDGEEVETYGTDPTSEDTDGDGLDDAAEVEEHDTDPTAADSDDDGLSDARELEVGTNPTRADTDGDGLDDGEEVNTYQTDPTNPDTDDDGLDDAAEVEEHDTDPTSGDTDDDGLADNLEVNTYGTDPNKVDTDEDGLDDAAEVEEHGTDPTDPDTDDDGLDDAAEVNTYGTNPSEADTDDDGLDDGEEVNTYQTDPTDPDTDGDGQNDLAEVRAEESGRIPLWVLGLAGVATLAATYVVASYRLDGVSLVDVWARLPTPDESSGGTAATTSPESENAGRSSGGSESTEDVAVEFLSAEEHVVKLLEDNGGRMQQSNIVEETGWSKAKTSRVLSEMADEGEVVKIQLGRGNVVSLPGELPPGVDPPE